MKHCIKLVFLTGLLLFVAIGSNAQSRYRIVSIYPSSSKVIINNAPKGVDDTFGDKDVIKWEKGQEITAKNTSTNRLCIFSEEAFASKQSKTVEQYRIHNQLSSRGEWPVLPGIINQQAFPERRIALVIGISNYLHLQPLQNSLRDANAVSKKLQSLGFDVIRAYDLQGGNNSIGDELHDIVRSFYKKAQAYDVALFYYAGHGLKYEKEDYLLPKDISLEKEGSYGLKNKGLSVMELVRMGYDCGVSNSIVVLDACRNESANWIRGGEIETGQIEPPVNCCIVYSTGSGKTAEDWSTVEDANSPFARAFLSCISIPGDRIAVTLDNIRTRVSNSTLNKQNPVYINRLSSDFIFNHETTGYGALSVTSVPSGASLFIDGKDSKERTNITIGELEPGNHAIDLKMDGFSDFHTSVQIASGVTSMLSITLEKKSSGSNKGDNRNTSTTAVNYTRIKQSLASFYSFDQQNADDCSGNGLDGICSAGVQFVEDTPSGTGYAARINGFKKGYINIPYNVFAGKLNYSISLWIKDFDYGMVVTAISTDAPRSDFPRLVATARNKFRFFTCYDNWDTTERFDFDNSVIKDSEWHHIVVTCIHTEDFSNNATKQLYVDGRLVAVSKGSVQGYYNVHGFAEDIIAKIQIGGNRNGAYDQSTSMTIDNVRFYTTAISKQTVLDLYQLRQ